MIRYSEVEKLNTQQKEEYYNTLFLKCKKQKGLNGSIIGEHIVVGIAPLLRRFKYEIRGIENIPKEENVIFVANHSNSHDIFVVKELGKMLGRHGTILVAWDGLNWLSRTLFRLANSTFIKRDDATSIEKGILRWCSKIINKRDGWIFGEATWNLHPILPMQKLKAGAVRTALITKKSIVPVIFEYVEVPKICKKEKELYSKCIVSFGKVFEPSVADNIFEQVGAVQKTMEAMRQELWHEIGVKKTKLTDVDADIYINHLYLKKFKAVDLDIHLRTSLNFFFSGKMNILLMRKAN